MKSTKTAKKTTAKKDVAVRLCSCSCGKATTNPRSLWKAGHDAAGKGQIIKVGKGLEPASILSKLMIERKDEIGFLAPGTVYRAILDKAIAAPRKPRAKKVAA